MAMNPMLGNPSFAIAIKMALKRKQAEEDKKKGEKSKPVTERDMLDKGSQVYGEIKKGEDVESKLANPRLQSTPYSETKSVEDLIKENFFVRDEQSGDLIPTEKYQEWKKAGKLKGKYAIK